jgi:serine protease Do
VDIIALSSFRSGLAIVGAVILLGLAGTPAPGAKKSFDISKALVGIKTQVPASARTARILGTERIGSGIVIDATGLILTIGYLILEADSAIVTGPGGRQVPATVVAYDHDSGFGLLRIRSALGTRPMRLGDSRKLTPGDKVLIASRGGNQPVIAANVVSRRVFTGGWEYMLESAIYTTPPHSFHSGAALIGEDGRLLGVGSLLVGNAAGAGHHLPGNMFVPVEILKPVLGELLEHGRRAGKARPWIGANTAELAGRLVMTRVSPGSPAAKAGIEGGDLILGVAGKPVSGQADFYRKIWSHGPAGISLPLDLLPKDLSEMKIRQVPIQSIDRSDWLRPSRSY